MEPLLGAYLLTITFLQQPIGPNYTDPYSPQEFSSLDDCAAALSMLATWMPKRLYFDIACTQKSTNEVHATYSSYADPTVVP